MVPVTNQNNSKINKKIIKPFILKGYKNKYDIYYSNPETGKRLKKTTGTTIQSQAIIALNNFIKEKGYLRNSTKPITLIEFITLIRNNFSNTKAPKTLEACKTAFDHLINIIGNKPIFNINQSDADMFVNNLLEKLQKSSINIYLRQLKATFNIAIEYGYICDNPFKKVKELRVPDKSRPNLTEEDIEKLFNEIDNKFIEKIVKFALYTGMRLSEIINLQWDDIDYNKRIITIKNKETFSTKTRKDREIGLTSAILNLLNDSQNINGNIIEIKNGYLYVFGNTNGFRYSSSYISKQFKRYVRKTNLNDKICFHSLRHTALTNMATRGIPLTIIKDLAGHTTLSTTQKYLHTDMEAIRGFMETVTYKFK